MWYGNTVLTQLDVGSGKQCTVSYTHNPVSHNTFLYCFLDRPWVLLLTVFSWGTFVWPLPSQWWKHATLLTIFKPAGDTAKGAMAAAGLRLQCKYKGHSNRNTQIRASFSADGNSIICGSDDGYVYVWSLEGGASSSQASSSQAAGRKVLIVAHALGHAKIRLVGAQCNMCACVIQSIQPVCG